MKCEFCYPALVLPSEEWRIVAYVMVGTLTVAFGGTAVLFVAHN
jgi:hypothetical protein